MSSFFTLETSDPEFEPDNIRHITVKSPALGHRADISLFIPPTMAETPLPLVILLHGVYGSHWAWLYKGGVHKTVLRLFKQRKIRPMVLAMPSDGLWKDGSGYLKHASTDFEQWIVEDVVQATIEATNFVTIASPLFIAGLSMGGFGALRLAAKHPQRFRGASGLSSITEFDQLAPFVEGKIADLQLPQSEKMIISFIEENRSKLPPIRFDCGLDDPLLPGNQKLHQQMTALSIDHVYQEFPGGHNWDYWRENIVYSLLFFENLLAEP